ncbi:hypothetical protein Tco_0566670 [Tanacetum coccineum]
MLAPNPSSSYNGRPSVVNPKYFKKAQFEKPCLYKIPYDKDDLANIFASNCDETLILEEESRSKLDKEFIKKTIVDLDWQKWLDNRWQQPITHEITLLMRNLLMPLVIKTKANANEFERALKQEMFEDLEHAQSLEKEVDELECEKAIFSNEYDLLLQECLSKDIMCAILHSFDNIDEQTELQCLYLEKIEECEGLEFELSKQREFLKNKPTNLSNHFLEFENMCLKKIIAQFKKDFSKLEAHCVALELKNQNQALQSGQHGRVLKDFDEIETINIELENIRDGENLDKMKEKEDSCIFVGYSTQSKGYRVYNKRTRLIVESIHINFDNLKEVMALIIPPINVNAEENNNNQVENAPFEAYDFINPFDPPDQKLLNHPLEQVRGDPSKAVQTRRKLATDPEMFMFALTMSTTEMKNIKEAMADHARIEAMQEELH